MRFSYHQLSEDVNSKGLWLLAVVFVNLTLFAVRFICIERGQFCTKCLYINLFKYMQTAPEHWDAICLAAQLVVRFSLCCCFENDTVSFCLIYTGLAATNTAQTLWICPLVCHTLCFSFSVLHSLRLGYGLVWPLRSFSLAILIQNQNQLGLFSIFIHAIEHDWM